jgi:hypothetical protein
MPDSYADLDSYADPDSYADRIARLVAAMAAHAAEQASAENWFAAQCAAARDSVADADRHLAAATASLAAAQDAVDFTDRESTRLWGVLASRSKSATLGPPPEPADDATPDGTAREHPGHLLDHARELLDEVKPARVRRPTVRVLLTLLLLVLLAGVVAATAVLRG